MSVQTYDSYGFPALTPTGPYCGPCGGRRYGARHATAAAILLCHTLTQERNADFDGAAAAELAYERHLEDRGYWDARADEVREAALGVIPFDVAYRQACPEAFPAELLDGEPDPYTYAGAVHAYR